MKMKYKNCVLFVKDIYESRAFYENIMGQKIKYDFHTNVVYKSGISLWQVAEKHEIHPLLKSVNSEHHHNFELYFETENIRLIIKRLKKNNIKFLHEIKEESWGQSTIRFFDRDGHLIEIGESMKTFINKLYNSGTSIKQISEKTNLKRKEIKALLKNR